MAKSGKYAGMYLGNPDIDFVKLAESQGVSGERVERGGNLREAIRRGTAAARDGKPYLVEVLIARYGGWVLSNCPGSLHIAPRLNRTVLGPRRPSQQNHLGEAQHVTQTPPP